MQRIIAALVGFGNCVLSQMIDLDLVKALRADPPTTKVPTDRLIETIEFDQDKAISGVIERMRNDPLTDLRRGSVEASDSVQKRQKHASSVINNLFDSGPACTDLNGTLYNDDASDS